MKKFLLTLTLTLSLSCFSQSITVDSDKYNVSDLVNKVLINSECVSATNVTGITGTNFGSTNGIGYFENTNPNFPMKSGVILSTGKATNAVGPNTTELNDGDAKWTGDKDLENTLALSGIGMESANATILEFDFTPISPNFDFQFLFASEEYGNFQCQFSDAFAFLLTDLTTGITTNLAVVPNTNIPISVVTIRNYLYNSSCSSENAQYFGSYNGGSSAANSATNFNGQTKLLKASATLSLNRKYHIKLVIADRTNDRSDTGADSAIFIASDSFNLGQAVLGDDLLLADNTALCVGETYVINSELNDADYTFIWKKNGTTISGATTSTLNVTDAGTYELTYQKKVNGCVPITDSVKIEYSEKATTPNPINLYKCDTGATSYTYDLSLNTPIILKGLDDATEVSYHISADDANDNINALPNVYTSNGNETIYVRIKVPSFTCPLVKTFKLQLTPAPIATKPKDMNVCSNTVKAPVQLSSQSSAILNGQNSGIYTVSYYATLADVTNGTNALSNSYNTESTTIYAKVQLKNDSNCFAITDFKVNVQITPTLDPIANVVICEEYTLPELAAGNYFTEADGNGTALFPGYVVKETQTIFVFNQPNGPDGCSSNISFEVKILDPLKLVPKSGSYCGSYKLPALADMQYRTETGGMGTVIKPGTVIKESQKVYVYFKSIIAPFCEINADFDITIFPTVNVGKFENVFDCVSYTLPELTVGDYYTQADGKGQKLAAGTVITTTQVVYVYAVTADGCESKASFSVIIGVETPIDVRQCEPYTLPKLAIGDYFTGPNGTGTKINSGTKINLTQDIYIYVNTPNNPNCTDKIHFKVEIDQPIIDVLSDVTACETYALPALTSGEYYTAKKQGGTKLETGTIINKSQTIYIFKASLTKDGCYNENSFKVNIINKPIIDSRSDVDVCNSYILTELSNGDYYTGPGGTGKKLAANTAITTSQRVYIYASASSKISCSSESSFNITIFPMKADVLPDVYICDNYILPELVNGNYYTKTGGSVNGPAFLKHAGDVINSSMTLYVFAESGLRANCTDESSFKITKVVKPVVNPIAASLLTICDEDGLNDGIFNYNLTQLNDIALGSQIPSEYKVEYFASQADAETGNKPITATTASTAFVRVSNTLAKDCYAIKAINIKVNKLPESTAKDGIICYDRESDTYLTSYTIQSGLSTTTHDIKWYDDDKNIVGTNSNYIAVIPGIYTLVATSKATGCESEPLPIIVSPSEPAILAYKVNEDFSDNSIVTISATGDGGNYEYKLGFGPYQDSPVFDNVPSGIHKITVRDKNGCGSSSIDVLVVKYPKFFTPNGDGYNDTWNISDLKNKGSVNINIYDRYGKLITNITPHTQGWDGTNSGRQLPSTDYWFTVNYTDDGITKEFKSHFSMKR